MTETPLSDPTTLRRHFARALLTAGGALVVLLVVAGFAFADPEVPQRVEAPAFELTLLDGETSISSADLRGHPVVLNAWASWCPSCREETPTLERVSKDLAFEDVQFVGIVSDDTAASAGNYADEAGLTGHSIVVISSPCYRRPTSSTPRAEWWRSTPDRSPRLGYAC
jgi:thiol-disulfide isomerase/thioredoxin